jgi:hypothetical protein
VDDEFEYEEIGFVDDALVARPQLDLYAAAGEAAATRYVKLGVVSARHPVIPGRPITTFHPGSLSGSGGEHFLLRRQGERNSDPTTALDLNCPAP